MPAFSDLTGLRFGRLLVQCLSDKSGKHKYWICLCDCGKTKEILGPHMVNGHTKSCGCFRSEVTSARTRKHGRSKSDEFLMWNRTKTRAKKKNLEFTIELSDIVIPETCPLLSIPLVKGEGHYGPTPNSPSLDRIDSSKGYIKGNVWVISHKANNMKSDSTLGEFQLLAKNWANKLAA
jgi:hypothetical protein